MKNFVPASGPRVLGVAVLVLLAIASFPGVAVADTCTGNCGTAGADGVVGLSPAGNSSYQWVSTNLGVVGVGVLPTGALSGASETNGSTFATSLFSATAGDPLNFFFNYTSSDGSNPVQGGEFSDYAWAALFDSSNNLAALLFTARTSASGQAVPAFGAPPPEAALTPSTVTVTAKATTWSPLGPWSGTCFGLGCGTTGWVLSSFNIPATGDYYLKMGAVNWRDETFDSGLAFDGITVAGEPITPPPTTTPEPATVLMLASGLLGAGIYRCRTAGRYLDD